MNLFNDFYHNRYSNSCSRAKFIVKPLALYFALLWLWIHILIRPNNLNTKKSNDCGASVSSVLSRPLSYGVYTPRPGKQSWLSRKNTSLGGEFSYQFYDTMTFYMRTYLVK